MGLINYTEKNLSKLSEQSRYKELYNHVIKYLANHSDIAEEYSCKVAKIDGNVVLYTEKNGNTYQLDTLYSREEAMELWLQSQATLSYDTKCIFCGLGNGMYVQKLLDSVDTVNQILVYEPSIQIFCTALQYYDLSTILASDRVLILEPSSQKQAITDALQKFMEFRDIRKAIFQVYPNYQKLHASEVKDFNDLVQLIVMKLRATKSVLERDGKQSAFNSLRNTLSLLRSKSIVDFSNRCPKDIPVFLVASGPSLSKNIQELKRVKDYGFLVAADSALPALLKEDIIPDMFITLDSKKSSRHTDDLRARDIACFCELESTYYILFRQRGDLFFMNDMNPYINTFCEQNGIAIPSFSTGGSVANSACAVMISMGFDTIILVGQDLAYTDDKTHADFTVGSERSVEQESTSTTMVEGYYGGKIRSSNEFILYREWFEDIILRAPEVHIYNATEGGALIHGAVNISLSEAIDRFCKKTISFEKIMNESQELLDTEQRKRLREHMLNLPNLYRQHLKKAEEAIRIYDKLLQFARTGKLASNQANNLLRKSAQIVSELESAPEMYYIFCLTQSHLYNSGYTDEIDESGDATGDIIQLIQKGKEQVLGMTVNLEKFLENDSIRYIGNLKQE